MGRSFNTWPTAKPRDSTAILIKYLNGFDDGPANPTGERNEGGYAFLQRDFERLNPAYFQALDRRMDAIWSHGFVAAIPAAWWGKTSKAVFDIQWAKRISAYCAVRYGAYNSLWCLSGEYQYAFKDCGWTEESFNDLGRTVQAHNPYGHPLSIHPSARLDWPPPHNCQSSRPFHDSGWLDHHWLQTGQSIDRMHNIVTRTAENRALSPPRPVFCSEGYYDVADDADQAYHARWQAWVAMLSGSRRLRLWGPRDLAVLRSGRSERRNGQEGQASRPVAAGAAIRGFEDDAARPVAAVSISLVAARTAPRLAAGRRSAQPAAHGHRSDAAALRRHPGRTVPDLHPPRQRLAHAEADQPA